MEESVMDSKEDVKVRNLKRELKWLARELRKAKRELEESESEFKAERRAREELRRVCSHYF